MPTPLYLISGVDLLPADSHGYRTLRLSGWDDDDCAEIKFAPARLTVDKFEQTRLPIEHNAAKAARRLRDMASAAELAGNRDLRRELERTSELLEGKANAGEYDYPTPESMGLVALAAAE